MSRPAERAIAFYNKRGTLRAVDQGRQRRDQVEAAVMQIVHRQCRSAPALCTRLHNLGNFVRTLATPEPMKDRSLPPPAPA
jgi:hypothetical protein